MRGNVYFLITHKIILQIALASIFWTNSKLNLTIHVGIRVCYSNTHGKLYSHVKALPNFFMSALTFDYLHYLVYALCIAKGIGSAISYIRAEYPDTAHNHGKMACFGEIMHGDVVLFQILFSLASSPEALGIIPTHSRQRLGKKAGYSNRSCYL